MQKKGVKKAKRHDGISAKEFHESFSTSAVFRSETFKRLLQHIVEGYSMDCFDVLSEVSIAEALKTYPLEFDSRELENAVRKAKSGWENIGRQQALGNCLGNSRSWFYNMAHRYDWSDKQKIETSGTSAVNVNIVNYRSKKDLEDTIENGM